MARVKKDKGRSAYAKMLGNIASDLDTLLTDLCHVGKEHSSGKEDVPCHSGTVRSADTLGKDSFFSSTGDTSRRQGDAISSSHSLESLSDHEHNDCDSADSGHHGRCRSGPSPLVFDPHHFGPQIQQSSPVTVELSAGMDELRPISTVERLIKTNSIWLLATMSRAGAVHILKDRETGVFIVRKSSQPNSLALSVQSRLSDHSTVDHYLIEGTNYGFRLQGSAHFFHSIPALIAYYVENVDEIPYHLCLPSAIQQAKSTRELASLDMLGQDFWVSSLSRKSPSPELTSGMLHKSCSEPINIQRPVQSAAPSSAKISHNTAPSKSASDFSHFMRTQLEMESYFKQHICDQSADGLNMASLENARPGLSNPSIVKQEVQPSLLRSHSNQTPPPGGTDIIVAKSVPAFKQSSSSGSKEILESVTVCRHSASTSKMETSHQLTRLTSENSWILASSPAVANQQKNFFSHSAQDIYSSNPNNLPSEVRDTVTSVQQHLKSHNPSHSHSLQDASAVKNQQYPSDGVTKERSWTHPVAVPKFKSNLYFTTNLGLLEIPENSYFTSNLSDKLSDYEDIWRNSCCESDADKNMKMIHDPRAILDAKVHSHNKKNAVEGKRKVLRKTSKDSPSSRRPMAMGRDAVTGGTTGLTALEQARMIAGSTSDEEACEPAAHIRGIRRMENMFDDEPLPMDTASSCTVSTVKPETVSSERDFGSIQIPVHSSHQIKFVTSHSLDFKPNKETDPTEQEFSSNSSPSKNMSPQPSKESASKCVFTTTMSVIISESSDKSSDANNNKHCNTTPLGHLSRVKSSSESSLATVSSPLYAEPADAVQLRDKSGKVVNIHIRRRSVPSAASLLVQEKHNRTKVSQDPQLDTILSPDAQATTNNSLQSKFLFGKSDAKAQSKSSDISISRSQSMRTTSEMSHLQSRQSWKDRLSRLKLGTKVLTRAATPPTGPDFRKNLTSEISHPDLDNVMFHDSTPSQTSAALSNSCPGRFPVSGQHEMYRASCFSDSSTVQDLISCAYPELSVRPIVPKFIKSNDKADCKPPSEYDNLVYRASTHSSIGTVYSPPWESGTANKLIKESPSPAEHVLPPAMDLNERIELWQQANSSYRITDFGHRSQATNNNSKNSSSQKEHSVQQPTHQTERLVQQQQQQQPSHQQFIHHRQQLQQRQLLEHQQQIKNEDGSAGDCGKSPEFHRQCSSGSVQQQQHQELHRQCSSGSVQQQQHQEFHHQCSSGSVQQQQHHQHETSTTHLHLNKNRLNHQGSGSRQASDPSSPQTMNIITTTTTTSPAAFPPPNRLSSHCPDVVNCHNTPASINVSALKETHPSKTSANVTASTQISGETLDSTEKIVHETKPAFSQQLSMSQNERKTPGAKIREYIFKLSSDRQTIFGSTIENFIQCTMESQEKNPQYVMRNVRQFMTGIKNYLVKHGEGELENLIERERTKLGANEILNIDAIIEQALHVCVLKPLKYHIYKLFVEKYSRNGALEQLSSNIKYARCKSAQDLGVKPGLKLPQSMDMEVIKHYLDLMQRSYSPLQKLQNLLKATSTIYHCVQGKHHQFPSRGPSSLGADDFLPILIYVIVHCGLVSAEIEADFMWGLLQPSLLTGEGGYYLTTLSSAVLILKNFQNTYQLAPAQMEGKLPTLSDMQGFLKIAIPDELHDSITWKTLPVRPSMNTRDVCAMVAHKFKITNPQDYGLYLLCNGLETQMADSDCPQIIKGDNLAMSKTCYFAFKRLGANIAWPKHMKYSPL